MSPYDSELQRMALAALLWIMLALVLLGGCASTQPIVTSETPALEQGRVLVQEWAQPNPDRSILLISRDKGFVGWNCGIQVYIGDAQVARLKREEQIRLYPPAGETTVSARADGGICGKAIVQTTLVLKAAQQSKLRVGYNNYTLLIEQNAL